MKNVTTSRFWQNYEKLPKSIQQRAKEQYKIFKNNPNHPSLNFKPVQRFWSARVNLNYRALAIKDDEQYIWVWIGSHDEYDKLVKRNG